MHLLFLSMSAHLTKELGMAPGGEFRAAFREVRSEWCSTGRYNSGWLQAGNSGQLSER